MNLRDILFCALLLPVLSFGQTKMPAKQIYFTVGTNQVNLQDYLVDTNLAVAGILKGTNIVGATFNASNGVWTVDSQVSGYVIGTNIVGATFADGQWTVSLGSVTSDIAVIYSRLDSGPIQTNFVLTDLNFGIISQDFRNVYAYLLGGTQTVYSGFITNFVTKTNIINGITNVFEGAQYELVVSGAVTNSTDGSVAGAALIPVLQYNQGVTQTNFVGVNQNTYFTTNLFSAIATILSLTNDVENYSNYVDWVSSFVQMDTNFTELPTNLSLNFPDIIQPIREDISSVNQTADVGFSIVGSEFEAFENLFFDYHRDFYQLNSTATNHVIDFNNGPNQYLIPNNNTFISLPPAPLFTFAELRLWVLNTNGYTIGWSSNNIASLDAAATNVHSGLTNSFLLSYQTPPWNTFWFEELVYPRVESVVANGGVAPPPATNLTVSSVGATITTQTIGSVQYVYHSFTNTNGGIFTLSNANLNVDILLVGAGGGGGGATRMGGAVASNGTNGSFSSFAGVTANPGLGGFGGGSGGYNLGGSGGSSGSGQPGGSNTVYTTGAGGAGGGGPGGAAIGNTTPGSGGSGVSVIGFFPTAQTYSTGGGGGRSGTSSSANGTASFNLGSGGGGGGRYRTLGSVAAGGGGGGGEVKQQFLQLTPGIYPVTVGVGGSAPVDGNLLTPPPAKNGIVVIRYPASAVAP